MLVRGNLVQDRSGQEPAACIRAEQVRPGAINISFLPLSYCAFEALDLLNLFLSMSELALNLFLGVRTALGIGWGWGLVAMWNLSMGKLAFC